MIFAQDSSILVIFCRRPALGVGKQRVAAELGTQAALEVATLLLATTLEDALSWPGPVVISPASPADTDWAAKLLPDAHVIAQTGGNLGERLTTVDQQVRAAGGQHIVYIGTDAPSLTPLMLAEAASQLDSNDAVFVPARDGGVTLMGASRAWPELAGLAWETELLGDELRECCDLQGFSICTLPGGFDIDLRQDLLDAPELLKDDPRPGRQKLLQWIAEQQLDAAAVPMDSVSVIVPTYRDHAVLGKLLTQLNCMRPPAHEVIVVDGDATAASTNSSASICQLHDAQHIPAEPCRGQQLRQGADSAQGEILWFVHADSELPENAIGLIREHISNGNVGGYFRFQFQGERNWYKALLEWSINIRARLGIPYGDQGLFARKNDYRQADGFAATPLFEEVRLVRGLRRQGSFSAVKASIGVATRRWERDGWLQRSLHNRYLAFAYMLGATPEKLVRSYNKQTESS